MAIIDIPTGVLPEEIVETLPQTGQENKVYRRLVEDEELREMQITDDFIWYDDEYHQFSFDARICGAYFERYQQSVSETVAEMEQTIAEQSALIQELEEAVFPVEQTSFEMLITSLMAVDLDLYDENDEIVPNMGLSTEYWEEPTELIYQNEVRKGTYYLKNSDGYALGKPNGDIQPLVCEGGTVELGDVEVVMLITGEAEPMIDEGDEE